MDCSDKLNPFGISVHGASDGFSREILGLAACSSNKDPSVIGGFYLDYVEKNGCFPSSLWSDGGTKSLSIAVRKFALKGSKRVLDLQKVAPRMPEQEQGMLTSYLAYI